MPVLVNKESGLAEDLPQEQVQQALANNSHEVPLIDPEGKHVTASYADAGTLLQEKYKQPSPEQLKSLLDYAKYSSTGEQLKTFAEGAAEAATFGASTGVERALGVKPEAIEARKEVNPGVRTAGQVTGLVVTTLAGVGEGALLGKAASALVPAAETALGRVGSAAARAGIENMIYQSGVEHSKAYFDPEQSIGSAVTEIGLSGLMGAAVGASLGGATELWKLGPGKQLGNLLESIKTKTSTAPVTEPLKDPGQFIPVSGEEFYNKIQEVVAPGKPLKSELSKGKMFSNEQIEAQAKQKLMLKANITPYEKEAYEGFKTFLSPDKKSGYAIKPDGELISVFSLEKGRGESIIDDAVLRKGAQKLDAFDINNKLPSLYGKYMDETSRLKFADEFAPKDWDYERLGRPDVVMMQLKPGAVPQIAAPVKSSKLVDAIWNEVPASALGMASMLFGHNPATGYILGKIGSLVGRETSEAAKLAVLKFLSSNADTSAEGLRSAAKMASAVIKGEAKLNDAVANAITAGREVIGAPSSKEKENLKEMVKEAASNPEVLMNIGGKLGHYLPEHGVTLAASVTNTLQYLGALQPHTTPLGPLDDETKTSKTAEHLYDRAVEIAQNPGVVINGIKQGTLTPDDVKHIASMYPRLYTDLQQKFINEVITAKSEGRSIPYKSRISLSLLMAQPLDASMTPESIMSSQPAVQPDTRMQQQNPTATGMQKLDKLPKLDATSAQSRQIARADR